MTYNEMVECLKDFLSSELIRKDFPDVRMNEAMPGGSPLISRVNPDLPKDSFGSQSGIYFICSADLSIYYIGKATKNNLHSEVWGKVSTPSVRDDGLRMYPKNYFAKKSLPAYACEAVKDGDVRLGVITISKEILASLSEVYLQSVYLTRTGSLPPLNSRIG